MTSLAQNATFEQTSESTQLVNVFTATIGNIAQQAVDARELHTFLQSKQDFSTWIKGRIRKYGFVENQDFMVFHKIVENLNGGRPSTEYHLTLDTAKELSMVENNDKGREARRYFIGMEKQAIAALMQGQKTPYQMPLPTMSDKRTRVPVKDAVTLLVAKSRNMNYSEAYGMIHQRFDVDSVEDLTNEQLPQVIEYIHKVVCEFIGKAELPAPKTQNILAETLQSITIMQGQVDYWQVRDALKQLTAILNQYQPYAHVRHVIILLETIERMMMRLRSMIDEAKQHASIFHSVFKTGKPLTTSNMDTLVSMESLLSRNMMVLQMPQYQNI